MSATVTRNNTSIGAVMQFAALPSGSFFELSGEPTLCVKLHNSAYKSINPASLVDVAGSGPECIIIPDDVVSITYDP